MSTPEYASRAELEQMRADLDDARQALRRESRETRNSGGGSGSNGDAPLTRAELRRALDDFREDVQDELRRAYRRGAEAERVAIAEAVCDELDARYIDDLDVDEVDDRIAKGKQNGGNGKAKAGAKPARGAEPKPEKGKELDRQGWLERLMSD